MAQTDPQLDPQLDPTPTDSAQARHKLWDLVKDIRFAMFTARHSNGHLHARPMTTQNTALDEDSSLWFFMSRASAPVADLAADPNVNIAYADPASDRYVSISGTAVVVEDLARKQRLWSTGAAAWFTSAADADLALIEVRIAHADVWDVEASRLVQLYHRARAAVTGKPAVPLGTHAEIRMG